MPDITEHLAGLGGSGVELSLACTEWFLTLFASPCDRDMTIRIWDSIFLLGDEVCRAWVGVKGVGCAPPSC